MELGVADGAPSASERAVRVTSKDAPFETTDFAGVRGLSSPEAAARALACGQMIVVVDAPQRENEGDLVIAAEFVSPEAINFMATHGRGLICVALTSERLADLEIAPMVTHPTDPKGTAFHVSVDHRERATTGISASDRANTIRALVDPASRGSDFTRPGHVFPLAYHEGGVLRRAGHTEASVDLAVMAGLLPAAVICEIAGEDGEMARLPSLLEFAAKHQLLVTTISDLIANRLTSDRLVERAAEAPLPLAGDVWRAIGYLDHDGNEHLALVLGNVSDAPGALVRVHSECLTGDVFGSRRCDCGAQLELALKQISTEGRGAVVYLRGHEGRGIGLAEKLRAYRLQDAGFDTIDANERLGHPADRRDYGIGMQILVDIGIRQMRLLTNNPAKRAGLEGYGLIVTDTVPLLTHPTAENIRYLTTKQARMGHDLQMHDPMGMECGPETHPDTRFAPA
jgi:3,4-dihydroxy 2-butanone 4-phosphate synthase / GTP cyclohydrolase II